MNKSSLLPTTAAIVGFLTLPVVANEKADLKKEFFSLYRDAGSRIENFYRNIRMEATFFYEPPKKSAKSPTRKKKLVFMSNGALLRLDEIDLNPANDEIVKETSYVATPKRSFIVRRDSSAKDFHLDKLSNDYSFAESQIFSWFHFPDSPYAVSDMPVKRRLNEDDVTVTSIDRVSVDSQSIVKVSYEFERGMGAGCVEFMPDLCWAVRSYWLGAKDVSYPGRQVPKRAITYKGDIDGIPLLSAVKLEVEITAQKKTFPAGDYTVTKIEPGPVDPYQFTPEAFGLHIPEPFNYNRLFLLLIVAVFLLVMGILIWRWKLQGATT
jgi:hypothetical protein